MGRVKSESVFLVDSEAALCDGLIIRRRGICIAYDVSSHTYILNNVNRHTMRATYAYIHACCGSSCTPR
jgi:hypothetical protein